MGQEEIRFEVFPTRNWFGLKRWNWRVRDLSNNLILSSSTGQQYSRHIDAHKAAAKVQRYAPIADIKDVER